MFSIDHGSCVGLDVHTGSISAYAITAEPTRTSLAMRFEGEDCPRSLLAWLRQLPQPVHCAYEVGSYGFRLARYLNQNDATCEVGRFPIRHLGRAQKTDSRDARAIARLCLAREFDTVYIPTEQEESKKELARLYGSLSAHQSTTMRQIMALLTKHGAKDLLTKTSNSWKRIEAIENIDLGNRSSNLTLRSLLAVCRTTQTQLDSITVCMSCEIARDSTMSRLLTLPGIGEVTAYTLAAEAMDFTRFASGNQFAAYIGLTPRAENTGGSVRQKSGRAATASARCLKNGAASLLRAGNHNPENPDEAAISARVLKKAHDLSISRFSGRHKISILARELAVAAWTAAINPGAITSS